jgi:intein-encoded DNA endonuclease-like protein
MKYNFNKNEVINLLKTEKKVQDVATKLNCTLISLQRYMRKENIKVAKRYSDDLRKQV